jgi:hypothetical protein
VGDVGALAGGAVKAFTGFQDHPFSHDLIPRVHGHYHPSVPFSVPADLRSCGRLLQAWRRLRAMWLGASCVGLLFKKVCNSALQSVNGL